MKPHIIYVSHSKTLKGVEWERYQALEQIANIIDYKGQILDPKLDIEIVYGTDLWTMGIKALILARKFNARLVLRCGGLVRMKYLSFPFKLIERYLVKRADKVIVNSKWLQDKFENSVLVPNHIYASKIPFKPRERGFNELLYVGRKNKNKGSQFLERFAWVTDFNLRLIYKLPKEEVFKAMDEADILVVPSFSWSSESSPNVVLEGLARGIPVVASNVNGIPELPVKLFDEGSTHSEVAWVLC